MAVRTIELDGADAHARGRTYGEAAADQINRAIDFYAASFLRKSGLQWPDLRDAAPHWVPLVAAYAPDLLEEMRGIAAGADVGLEDILLLNGRGELNQGNAFAAAGVPGAVAPKDELAEGCTTFAVLPDATGNGHMVVGQNWDWREAVADTLVVLRITTPGKPTIITQVEAVFFE